MLNFCLPSYLIEMKSQPHILFNHMYMPVRRNVWDTQSSQMHLFLPTTHTPYDEEGEVI